MSTAMHPGSLKVGRLNSRFLSAVPLDDQQVQQWHEAFADQDASELVGRMVADDEWLLIHRLPLHVRWRPDTPAAEAGRVWIQHLQQAVQAAADEGDARNVLRYRSWRHGLADLIHRSALGETGRQWAWRQMGLLGGEGRAASDALLHGARLLHSRPEMIWPVVHQALQAEADHGVLTTWVRRLPGQIWQGWWVAAPQTRAWMSALAELAPAHALDAPRALHDAVPPAPQSPAAGEGPSAQALLAWAQRQPAAARMLGDVLTAWLAALRWPHGPDATASQRQLDDARRAWQGLANQAEGQGRRRSARAPAATSERGQRDQASATQARMPSHGDVLAGLRADQQTDQHAGLEAQGHTLPRPDASAQAELPEAPDLGSSTTLLHTAHAGALFWLRHLGDQAVPPSPLQMQALAVALHVPVDDPVMQVLTSHQPAQPIPPATQAQADQLVASWSHWLDEALPDAPAPRMDWVCQRPGRLHIEPGWIELYLDLKQVDTRIRRIGLDLDPGWVPALQAVVRIRYE
ncbi:MAG: hypothetical protein QM742_12590 [Aquabacterium sp.]